MHTFLHALLAAWAVSLAGCESGLSGTSLVTDPSGTRTVLITNSPGGNVDAFDRAFRNWSHIPGVKVEIQRWCASACTQVLGHFQPEQVCLSPGARVGFHSATRQLVLTRYGSAPGMAASLPDIDPVSTLIMFAAYPGWVQYRLSTAKVMGLGAGNRATSIAAEEFWRHGYKVCPNTLRADASPPAGKEGS